MTTDVPTLYDDIAKGLQKKCVNCGHDVIVYHHPLGSSRLVFHNNSGVFAMACVCGCKNPEVKV